MLGWAAVLSLAGCGDDNPGAGTAYEAADLERGGQLYDQWWSVPGVKSATAPTSANPGYSMTTGTQMGAVTWRCKECHGWDYRGAQGAYATGSHATGVPGLLAVKSEPADELFTAIKSGVPGKAMTAFGSVLADKDIWDLVKFVREGLVDTSTLIDSTSRAPIGADAAKGATLFMGTCSLASCHGPQGNALNFGTDAAPEYVGTVASENPWEFFHKVRAGQPGTDMPSAIKENGWTVDDIMDTLAHARTLPAQ